MVALLRWLERVKTTYKISPLASHSGNSLRWQGCLVQGSRHSLTVFSNKPLLKSSIAIQTSLESLRRLQGLSISIVWLILTRVLLEEHQGPILRLIQVFSMTSETSLLRQMKPRFEVTKRVASVSMLRVVAVRPAQVTGLSRLKCTSCQMYT